MNAPFQSDSISHAPGASRGPSAGSYAPSVPISVYRELAAELKVTQQSVNALTKQNQSLVRQNQLLRNEIQRFVQAAEQLGSFIGVSSQEASLEQPSLATATPNQGRTHRRASAPSTVEASQAAPEDAILIAEPVTVDETSMIVAHSPSHEGDRPTPPSAPASPVQPRLFTEQPEGMRPLSKTISRPDLNNLWLATTILMVIVTAFGAGFLIMRPLMQR